ncbi:unnamed protein product [Ambrosiozyma monospora]|uniref:Unnamed protein product n=1 Tax=Ambrosiozyma monospora TaxID=43982 RepID=A0ACB5SXQ9_AMBMO|nr:unnamed protein product [Ambrosiozyma monospora]
MFFMIPDAAKADGEFTDSKTDVTDNSDATQHEQQNQEQDSGPSSVQQAAENTTLPFVPPVFKESTTISNKFELEGYESVFSLYHDIKLACLLKMLEHENDTSTMYKRVDTFYKVAVELLLRETLRLGLSLQDNKRTSKEGAEQDEPMETSLESTLSRDFELVSSVFINKTGETLNLIAQNNLPLFTSSNSWKSEIDDREPIIDASLGINIVKIVPSLNSLKPDPLSSISPKVPTHHNGNNKDHTIKEVLENYMHPNWLRLTTSQWLKHGGMTGGDYSAHFSFAPSCDESRATVSDEWKRLTWLQHIGFEHLVRAQKAYKDAIASDEKKENENGSVANGDVAAPNGNGIGKQNSEEVNSISKYVEMTDDSHTVDNNNIANNVTPDNKSETTDNDDGKIDLENLLKWSVGHKIEPEEKQAVKSNAAQQTISKLLLELSELRKSRIIFQKQQLQIQSQLQQQSQQSLSQSQQSQRQSQQQLKNYKIIKTSKQEVEKFTKVRRLIQGLINSKDISPGQMGIKLSTKLPVFQHNYSGVLPAPMHSAAANSYGRASGVRSNKRRR